MTLRSAENPLEDHAAERDPQNGKNLAMENGDRVLQAFGSLSLA